MGGVRTAMVSLIFPGQGSQYEGMGGEICGASPAAAAVFKSADDVLGFSISDVCFNGPAEKLGMTEYCQPALFTAGFACWEALKAHLPGFSPDMLAGHSLGELTALAVSGCMAFEDGLRLVRKRGLLMARAGEHSRGTMSAVLGMDDEALIEICGRFNVSRANINSPGQVVVSGGVEDVAGASEDIKAAGGKVIPLNVAGAFHSPYMREAAGGFTEELENVDLKDPGIPVYSNVDARPHGGDDEIRKKLVEQLYSPVLWQDEVLAMAGRGADVFIEVGPRKVLSKLVQKIQPGAGILSVEDSSGMEKAAEFLEKEKKQN